MESMPDVSIVSHFKDLPDPRIERAKKHRLIDIIVIALGSIMVGGDGFQDMELFGKSKQAWLQQLLDLPNGIPRMTPLGGSLPADSSGSKVWAIGVDSDQYNTADPAVQEFILTSMLKRVDVAVFELINAAINGTVTAGSTTYDLSVDGVGYSKSGGFVDDISGQLDDFKDQIVAGDIVVPTVP